MKKILLFLSLIIISTHLIFSQNKDKQVPDIITDRPDQTESAAIVPLSMLQVETGFVYEGDETDFVERTNTTFNTTLLRYGLFKNAELRMGMEYLEESMKIKSAGLSSSVIGFGPLYTGIKVKITEEKGAVPEMAILGSLTWPATADENLKPSYVAPAMRLAFAHTLSENLSLGYNLGAEWNGEVPDASYYYSLALGIGLTSKIGAFVESYGFLYEEFKPDHKADAGFTYLLSRNFQIDLSGGIGLSEISPDYFVGFGLSYRIPE
jgi:hypothetical protein